MERRAARCDCCGDCRAAGGLPGPAESQWSDLWFCRSCWEEWDCLEKELQEERQWREEERPDDVDDGGAAPAQGLGHNNGALPAAGLDPWSAYWAYDAEEEDSALGAVMEEVLNQPLPPRPGGQPFTGIWRPESSVDWWHRWHQAEGAEDDEEEDEEEYEEEDNEEQTGEDEEVATQEEYSEETEAEDDRLQQEEEAVAPPPMPAEQEDAQACDAVSQSSTCDMRVSFGGVEVISLSQDDGLEAERGRERGRGSEAEFCRDEDEVIDPAPAFESSCGTRRTDSYSGASGAAADGLEDMLPSECSHSAPLGSEPGAHSSSEARALDATSDTSSFCPNEALLAAARISDCRGILSALEARADVNTKDVDLNTPLCLVAAHSTVGNCTKALSALLRASACVDSCNDLGETPLLIAAGRANAVIVPVLLQRRADPNRESLLGESPLGSAIGAESLGLVKLLLRHRAHVTDVARAALLRCPALHKDGTVRDAMEAPILSSSGSTVSASSSSSPPPSAADPGECQSVAADDDIPHDVDVARFWQAIQDLDVNGVVRALAAGVDVNMRAACGTTPLLAVVSATDSSLLKGQCRVQMASRLLERRADVGICNLIGESSLQLAIRSHNSAMAELLLRNRADPDRKDSFGENPLAEAILAGDEDVVALLVRHRAKVVPEELPMHAATDHPAIEHVLHREAVAELHESFMSEAPDPQWVRGFAPRPGETPRQEAQRERSAIVRDFQVDREYFDVRHPPRAKVPDPLHHED